MASGTAVRVAAPSAVRVAAPSAVIVVDRTDRIVSLTHANKLKIMS